MAHATGKDEATKADDAAKAAEKEATKAESEAAKEHEKAKKTEKTAKRRADLLSDTSKVSTQLLKDAYFKKEMDLLSDCTLEELEAELTRRNWK